jgi:phosphate transport system permease protein
MSVPSPSSNDLTRILASRRRQDRLFNLLGIACTMVGIVTLSALLIKLIIDGAGQIDWQFLTSFVSYKPENSGILAPLVGSLLVMIVTALTAVPLGIAAGVYLEEYGKRTRISQIIEINIANLAGVPSIIYGLLALGIFITFLGQRSNVLVGGLTLAMLILPIVIVSTREALRAIPKQIREAAYGLGATKWQVIWHHLIPYSIGGISTGVIIALSRAIGETAPLIVVGAVGAIFRLPPAPVSGEFPFVNFEWLDSRYTVLPLQMFSWIDEPKEAFHQLAAATGLVLIMITLSLNAVAIVVRYRARKRIKW